METKDILFSTVSAEEPIIHSISINGNIFNIGIELQNITLLGSSQQSVNSEYRTININTHALKKLLRGELKPQGNIFYRIKKNIDSVVKGNTISADNNEMKRITSKGFDVAIIYYLISTYLRYSEADAINMNKFSFIIIMMKIFNKHIQSINHKELVVFVDAIREFSPTINNIGSKLFLIDRSEIEHTNDVSLSLWKEIYIYKLIRSIPIITRKNYLCPMLDWGLIKYPSKQLFTNDALITKLNFGSNINYIRTTSARQNRLSHDLIIGSINQHEINEIKELTDQLVESTKDIDYALDNLSMIMFFSNMQQSMFSAINQIVDVSKENGFKNVDHPIKQIVLDIEAFKQIVFQYMFALLLLARQGIIHNDPHMNNIMVSTHKPFKLECGLPDGKMISLGMSEIDLTVIDFDKAILSHHHHNFFDIISNKINEEIGIVLEDISDNSVKKTIVDDYDQIFNCYVMYDVIRFSLVLRKIIMDMLENLDIKSKSIDMSKHEKFIDNIIKIATDILAKIYVVNPKFPFDVSEPHSSILWMIETVFKDYIKINKSKSSIDTIVRFIDAKSFVSDDTPEFVSSKRRYADKLKMHFISEYVAKHNSSEL